ncbi:asparagine synthase-related protein [Novosphingobium sp. ZW T3_23]|uniref:asparagine synthase-related protein n=1 Tax=Novosphingobium sp. ZW T3_23 TaxID=3378084 RepID=UPI003852A2FD
MTGHRYLILVPRGECPSEAHIERIARLTGLPYRAEQDRLVILTDRSEALYRVGCGLVSGTLFHRFGSARPIGYEEELDLGPQPAKRLLQRYWGSYVAVLLSADAVMVIRDPSGATPAHYAEADGLVLVASDAALLQDAGAISGEIDDEALARHIYLADLPLPDAPLAGARRLSPGSALKVTAGDILCETLWNPWNFVEPASVPRSLDEVAAALSRTTGNCIQAWANCFSSILVGVSGGLDSSIVTACLAGREQAVTGLTLVAPDPAGDERGYASALCEHLGVTLREEYYALEDVDPVKSCVSHLAFPSGRTQSQAYNAAVSRAMQGCGAEAFFTGNGGDNVFFLSQSTRGLIDLRRSGASIGEAWQALRDICALTGCSFAAAIRQARKIARGPSRYEWRPDLRFLSDATIRKCAEASPEHPWLDAPPGALPGKAAHIAMILRIQNHVEGFDPITGPLVVNPLLSQPILEECLAIPTWLCFSGGRDRAVARRAYRDRLPAMVADRRVKGGPDGFASAVLEANLPQIRDRLLGGRLAERGIIDLAAVEQALRPGAADRGPSFVPLLFFLDMEGWIEHWMVRSSQTNSPTCGERSGAEF